jgi:hypothetical protein
MLTQARPNMVFPGAQMMLSSGFPLSFPHVQLLPYAFFVFFLGELLFHGLTMKSQGQRAFVHGSS